MKTPYFTYNGKHVACIPKAGSSAIARAIHFALKPDYQIISASGNPDMVERVLHNPGWQALAPKTYEPVAPIIPLRDPVERFRSACAQEGKTAEDALSLLESDEASQHFRQQSGYLTVGDNFLYRFPEDIDALATELGLSEIPEVNTSEINNAPKPDLTPEQLARVQAIYADDIALYESITEAGQVWTKPPTPTTDVDKAKKLAELAAARYAEEMGGIEVDGILIKTDERTRGILTAGMVEARDNPEFSLLNWKISDGNFVDLSALQILSIYEAVDAHIAATFAKERTLSEQVINATTVEELEAITW